MCLPVMVNNQITQKMGQAVLSHCSTPSLIFIFEKKSTAAIGIPISLVAIYQGISYLEGSK